MSVFGASCGAPGAEAGGVLEEADCLAAKNSSSSRLTSAAFRLSSRLAASAASTAWPVEAEGLVPEEVVGAREALEVGGGVGVVGALVRVAQPRLRPVRLLDLLEGEPRALLAGGEAEHLVVVDVVVLLPHRRHGFREFASPNPKSV